VGVLIIILIIIFLMRTKLMQIQIKFYVLKFYFIRFSAVIPTKFGRFSFKMKLKYLSQHFRKRFSGSGHIRNVSCDDRFRKLVSSVLISHERTTP